MKTIDITKRTKGEWFITDVHIDNGSTQIGSDKDIICNMSSMPDDEANEEENAIQEEANAHYICLAVNNYESLLNACKQMQEAINNAPENWLMTSEVMEAAKQIDLTLKNL